MWTCDRHLLADGDGHGVGITASVGEDINDVRGACASKYVFIVEIPLEVTVAITIGVWTWYKSRQARLSHDDGSGRLVLLPAYQAFLYTVAATLLAFSIMNTVYYFEDLRLVSDSPARLCMVFAWNMALNATRDGILLWFCKPSTGTNTMKRVAWQSAAWGSLHGIASLLRSSGTKLAWEIFSLPVFTLRGLLHLCVICLPASMLYRRPSAKKYAVFGFITFLVEWSLNISFWIGKFEVGLCLMFVGTWFQIIALPPVLYYSLLTDSHYWRGLLDNNDDITSGDDKRVSLRAPLMGISLTEATSYALTEELDGGAMKAKQLNYALLSLGQPRDGKTSSVGNLLAAGGTARVYAGTYKDQPLAIKLIYCLELTPEIVRNFGREANKLASLNRNKHVVQLIGICVRPPSLAMALELCYYGSLSDVIERHYHHSGDGTSKGIILDIRTRLILALHCSRAIAAMHSLRPSLLHLDIKAQNFLVALNTNYTNNGSDHKLSSSPIAASSLLTSSKSSGLLSSFNKGNIINEVDKSIDDSVAFIVKIADLELSTHMGDNNIRIPDTHQWTAPELLTGSLDDRKASASTSSDIFALGCVFYEIETGCIPYSTCPANINIIARITSSSEQLRPISLTDNTHLPAGINQSLLELMRLCWSHEPSSRPSANDIVQRLITMVIDHS